MDYFQESLHHNDFVVSFFICPFPVPTFAFKWTYTSCFICSRFCELKIVISLVLKIFIFSFRSEMWFRHRVCHKKASHDFHEFWKPNGGAFFAFSCSFFFLWNSHVSKINHPIFYKIWRANKDYDTNRNMFFKALRL